MVTLADVYAQALNHHRAGRYALAEQGYRQTLALVPTHVESWHLLGLLAAQTGQAELAVTFLEHALALRPSDVALLNSLGLALKEAGQSELAVTRFQQALAIKPDHPQSLNSLAIALQGLGRLEEAIGYYRQALALQPDDSEICYNLATAFQAAGHWDTAITHYRQVLQHAPDHARSHNNLATLLYAQGQLAAALPHHQNATALAPDLPEAHYNLATTLQHLGRLEEAVAAYRHALALKSDYAKAHNNLGTALQALGFLSEAAAHYRHALTLQPHGPDTLYNLGTLYQQQGQVDEAADCHRRALDLDPDHASAAFAFCIAQLPLLYATEAEIEPRRIAYATALNHLIARFSAAPAGIALQEAVGASQPFYLAYQGRCDRDLQQRYGALVGTIMARSMPPAALPAAPRAANEPIRVGIVSGFFRAHSNWKIPIKGWLSQLDRCRFQVFGYHTGLLTDDETRVAASLCHRFVQGPLPLSTWRSTILADALHVLIYPEIGMDPMAARLAALRLARHQCNAWGHPETSGYPTLDSFLSSDFMEPPEGESHYTETLIRLPNLSIYYEPVEVTPLPLTRPEMGFRPEATVFWCGQALFKYLPQYDHLLPRIAREVGNCQFAFIGYPRGECVTNAFRERLRQAFAADGLSADASIVILPSLTPERFLAAIGLSDIVLDSIDWSGCNSTLEGLVHNLPLVTLPGSLMRGRHGLAILTMMGVTDTVAQDTDHYVSLAVRLAQDKVWRQSLCDRIAANRHRLYRDRSAVTALEEVLERMARG